MTANNVETYFSIFKRGMKGVYQHCKERHLHRYLTEFDFRYNNYTITDAERRDVALKGIEGKCLTYRLGELLSGRTSKPQLTRRQFRAMLRALVEREGSGDG